MTNKLTTTAPERVWLEPSNPSWSPDEDEFPSASNEDVNIHDCELEGSVEYIRADIAEARMRELEKDAARLDWMDRQGDDFFASTFHECLEDDNYLVSNKNTWGRGDSFRSAIDAARKNESGA